MINKLRDALPFLAALLLCGCLDYTDKVTINPDGSGVVHIEVRTTLPTEMFDMMSFGDTSGGDNSAPFPPLTKSAAAKSFPAKDFEVSVTQNDESETNRITIDAKFKDIAALLNSRYAESRGLSLKIEGDKLVFKARSGLEVSARSAASENAESMQAAFAGVPGQKLNTNGPIRFQFEVVLPGAIAESTGANSGNTAKWTVEKGKLDGKQLAEKLGETMRATCPAAAIQFTPVTPVRLALENFNDLSTNTIKATSTIDAEKVKAAAKFVPYAMRVTRSLDLSGSGTGGQQNSAMLTGALTIPAALAPQQWGEIKLQEAKDAKGKSLVPSEEADEGNFTRTMSHFFDTNSEGDDEDDNSGKPKDEVRHTVVINMTPPDWGSLEIARIKATAALLYFGGSQIVKLPNAIPEKSIIKLDGANQSFAFNENSERALSDPKLTQVGLKLKIENAMQNTDDLNISINAEGKNGIISGLQIYDADGKPWPTTLNKSDFGEGISYNVSVTGKPKPPLSIALLAPDAMTKVEIPIVVEKIPVRAKSK